MVKLMSAHDPMCRGQKVFKLTDRAPVRRIACSSARCCRTHLAGQIIVLSKGLWSQEAAFQGVVSVTVRMDAVEGLADGLFSAANGAIVSFRTDGTLLMAMPDLGLSVGQAYPGARLFTTL